MAEEMETSFEGSGPGGVAEMETSFEGSWGVADMETSFKGSGPGMWLRRWLRIKYFLHKC